MPFKELGYIQLIKHVCKRKKTDLKTYIYKLEVTVDLGESQGEEKILKEKILRRATAWLATMSFCCVVLLIVQFILTGPLSTQEYDG